ncbi:putative bifunctional diguanylate cyclase/phosphodiesterase [Hoeflea marina]|nr:EAL domain-containing protein [Hoeflea marina]
MGNTVLAADVRLSFVESLYQKRETLFAGMIVHVIVAMAVYLRLNDPFYLFCALAVFCIWFCRVLGMRAFDRCDSSKFTLAETLLWERWYVAGSLSIAFTLGSMSAYALVVANDPFAELATISVTMATMISVVGRNFGSRLNADMIILAACLPLMAGFMLAGDPFMIVLAIMLLPFFLTTRSMANGVRDFLFNTVTAERETAQIAERFDTALNNMSHGLFMLDGDGRIEVANHKAREIFNIEDGLDLRGRSFKAALRLGTRNGKIDRGNLAQITSQLERLTSGGEARTLIKFDRKTWLEFTSRRRGENGVVLIFEDVTSRIEQDDRILHMARFDSLTELPNRNWFGELVAEKLSRVDGDHKVALAVLDIDDFKHVNDTRGHVSGDKLLCAISARLRSMARHKFVVSRFGGDEFVLFFPDAPDAARLTQLMNKVIDTVRGTYLIDGNKIYVSLSAGVALAPAREAILEDLQIRADLALYDAKRRDKNRWSLFVESMDAKYSARQRLKADLREAIRGETMGIVYQPMFEPTGTRIVGAEALSRWNHPDLGPISPAVYIPLAEELGIISDLTHGMINKAARDCATWPDHLFVSVNLSAHDVRSREIVSVVADTLDRHNLDAKRLHLEITESALMDDLASVRTILQELRSMGVTMAIDDFGTGYSSLSYLDMLPINKVKIDRAFVMNITEDERKLKLLRGVVHLSRELGLDIVVEGVETEAQLKLIQDNNCADLIQGFIFGMPMPNSALVELMNKLGNGPYRRQPVSMASHRDAGRN